MWASIVAWTAVAAALDRGFCAADADGPRVAIRHGDLRGKYMTSKDGRKFCAFLGVPFAKPPLKDLRFKPPVPEDPWDGVYDATKPHAVCPQRDIYRRTDLVEGEEDCLYLNVYTPKMPGDETKLLPVMIFFHGGGWLCGSGNSHWYGPDSLLDRDIVLVVTNYRLGALGFLSTGDDVVPGNNGLKDQSLALKWVKENIIKFGGDPDSITLFGESAGGASVHYHMLSPQSKGLFHKAILMSGTALCTWTLAPKNEAVEHAQQLAESFKCPVKDSRKMVECLRKVKDPLDFVRKDTIFMKWDFDPMIPFKPVIESKYTKDPFLTEHPIDIISAGKMAQVPIITGITSEDGALRTAGIFGNPHLVEELNNELEKLLPISLHYDKTARNVKGVTEKIKKYYFNNEKVNIEDIKPLTDLYTDAWFLSCADETVTMQLKYSKQPVYYYLFGYRGQESFTKIFGGGERDYGVCHADDLQYLFPIGDGLFPNSKPNKSHKQVTKLFTTLFTNFAATGDPTPETNEVISEKWEPVKSSETMHYYFINDKCSGMRKDLLLSRARFWRSLEVNPREFSTKYNATKCEL